MNCNSTIDHKQPKILIIGFCILLRVILTVNNTFFFATIGKVFYYVASVLSIVAKKKVLFTVNLRFIITIIVVTSLATLYFYLRLSYSRFIILNNETKYNI
jgi:hypothetical protein